MEAHEIRGMREGTDGPTFPRWLRSGQEACRRATKDHSLHAVEDDEQHGRRLSHAMALELAGNAGGRS